MSTLLIGVGPRDEGTLSAPVSMFSLSSVLRHKTLVVAMAMAAISVCEAEQEPLLPPVVAVSQKLTLAQAESIAMTANPQIKAAEEAIKSARANLEGQRVPVNPEFYVSGLNNTLTSNLSDPSSYAFVFTVETNGAIQWRTSQAWNQWRQAIADGATAANNLRQSVADAYINLQTANADLENEVQATEVARRLGDLTESQFKLGAAPETNAIRARIAVTQEEANLIQTVNEVETARANLNNQLGRDAKTPVDVADALSFAAIQPPDQIRAIAQKDRPEIISAEYNLKALQATIGLQRTQYLPVTYVGSDLRQVRQGSFEVGLQLPLFDFGSIRGSIQKAEHDAKAQKAQVELTRQSVSLDVETALSQLKQTQLTVLQYQGGILDRSQSLLQKIEAGYKLGANTILDLIDAEETLRSARHDYYSALGADRTALAQLEHAIGHPLPSTLLGAAQTTTFTATRENDHD